MMFRVGDIVTGTKEKLYVITNNQGIMRVEEVRDDNMIVVRLLFHETKKDFIGRRFSIDSAYFKRLAIRLSERNIMDIVSPTKTPSWLL